MRQAQIASIERQIEAAIKGGTDTTALEATYLARVEIARDEHRAAAVDLRRRGELHAAMDAFREAKHLDFVYQHRKALVEAGGLGDAPPPPEVIARRRLEAAHARLVHHHDAHGEMSHALSFPRLRGTLLGVTIVTFLGLTKLNIDGPGVTESFKSVWRPRKE